MMILDREGLPDGDLPMAALADHMRLSDGWADVPGQAARLRLRLRAAITGVEARTGKALILRGFTMAGEARTARVPLALAPVASVDAVELDGVPVPEFGVTREAHRTVVDLARVPVGGGRLTVALTAGHGTWDAVPGALREAVLRTAEAMDLGEGPGLPGSVAALLAPWRPVRLGAGA